MNAAIFVIFIVQSGCVSVHRFQNETGTATLAWSKVVTVTQDTQQAFTGTTSLTIVSAQTQMRAFTEKYQLNYCIAPCQQSDGVVFLMRKVVEKSLKIAHICCTR